MCGRQVLPTHRCQIKHRLSHLCQPMPRDSQHLSATGHLTGQQHDMPMIHSHSVAFHHIRDLSHNGGAGGFDSQRGAHLQDVVTFRLVPHHSVRAHNIPQTGTLNAKLVRGRPLSVINGNHSPGDVWQSSHNDIRHSRH